MCIPLVSKCVQEYVPQILSRLPLKSYTLIAEYRFTLIPLYPDSWIPFYHYTLIAEYRFRGMPLYSLALMTECRYTLLINIKRRNQ